MVICLRPRNFRRLEQGVMYNLRKQDLCSASYLGKISDKACVDNFDGMTEPFIFFGPLVHSLSPQTLEIIDNGAVVVSEGRIVTLKKEPNLKEIQEEHRVKDENVHVLGKGQFLIPGFIDTHTHAPQYPNIGLSYDLPLLEWLENYTFPLEKKYRDEKFAANVYDAVVKKTIENGTTTCMYFATIHTKSSVILAKSAQKLGQRAFVGKVNMNINSPGDYCETLEESLAETRKFVEEVLALKNDLVKPIITPRFALSCDMNLMKGLSQIARRYNLPIQTHISENKKEVELVEQLYGRNYANVYDDAGLITENTILAHGVYLKPEEMEILKGKGATISHCASSNSLLKSGLCPVRKLLDFGLNVALGSDCSGGRTCSMLETIRETLTHSIQAEFNGWGKKLSHSQVFYMATQGGANALSLGHKTGNFEVGKDFDAILINMKNPSSDLFEDYTTEQLFQKFIYTGDDRFMTKVFVAGKLIKDLQV